MRHRALVVHVRSFGNRPYQALRYCLVATCQAMWGGRPQA